MNNADQMDIKVKVEVTQTDEEVNPVVDGVKLFQVTKSGTRLVFNRPPADLRQFVDAVKSLDSPGDIIRVDLNFDWRSSIVDDRIIGGFDLDVDLDGLLPNVKKLNVGMFALTGLNLRASELRVLNVGPEYSVIYCAFNRGFSFRLPSLHTLYIRNVSMEGPSDLAKSVSASPKLRSVCLEGVRGLAREPTWYLPSCTQFELNSDVMSLKLYCPRLDDITITSLGGSCLKELSFVKRGKAEHREYNVKCEEDMAKIRLALFNVWSEELKQRLREHPRVKKVVCDENLNEPDTDHDSDDDIKRYDSR